jgi:PAS domain-containing protein
VLRGSGIEEIDRMSDPPTDGRGGGATTDRPLDSERDRDAARAINQRIFETSLDLILVVDRQGNFIRVSPSSSAILGYQPGEMVGRSATAFIYPDDLESTRREMRLARRGHPMRNF